VVELNPRDKLRYGYRIWSEKKSGLVVKLQTLDVDGRVLEQAAFSELQLDAPVQASRS
jgi:sigma-E factor negative regulatory protein RseB